MTNYHLSGQTAKEVHDSWLLFTGSRASKVTRAASPELFPRKNVNTKWPPVKQTCESMNFCDERERQHVFWPLSGQNYQNSWPKNYDEPSYAWSNAKNCHRLSWRVWTSSNWMIVHDSWWSNGSARSTIIDCHRLSWAVWPGLNMTVQCRDTSFISCSQYPTLVHCILARDTISTRKQTWYPLHGHVTQYIRCGSVNNCATDGPTSVKRPLKLPFCIDGPKA